MAKTRAKTEISAEKAAFIEAFRTRFREWKASPLSRPEVAEALELSKERVSEYTSPEPMRDSASTPQAYGLRRLAQRLNVSECWLAFGNGPRDPIAAQLGNQFGENFANDPDLAHICSAWLQANEEDKALLKAWAKKFPRPKINPLATPPGKPSKPADAPPKFAKPPLSQSELLLVLGYLSDVTESSLAEKPLLIAFERLATFLAPLVAPQTPAEHSDGSLPEEGNGDTDEPSDEAGGPRSASPRR